MHKERCLYALKSALFRFSVCNLWAIDHKYASNNKSESSANDNTGRKD